MLTLTACSDPITEEANESKKEKEKAAQAEKEKEKNKYKIYDDMEEPLEEVVKEAEVEERNVVDSNYEVKDSYKEPQQFANFTAKQLFDFYTLKSTPEDYFNYIDKYGSERLKKDMPVLNEKESGVTFLTNVQGLFEEQGALGKQYELTDVKLNTSRREGHFYRKVIDYNKELYYITTIVLEDGVWKFYEDSPSVSFGLPGTDPNKSDSEKPAATNKDDKGEEADGDDSNTE